MRRLNSETRYKGFAAVWEYTEYWDIYGRKGDIFGKRPNGESTGGYHAYSHVNTLSGLGAAYLAKGDRHYLGTLENHTGMATSLPPVSLALEPALRYYSVPQLGHPRRLALGMLSNGPGP